MSSNQICKKTHLSIMMAFMVSGVISLTAIAEIVTNVVGSDHNVTLVVDDKTREIFFANESINGG